MVEKWIKRKTKTIIKDKWIHLTANEFETKGTTIAPYYLLHYPDWVSILALTENNDAILIKQYRPGSDCIVTGLPAGTVDSEDDSPIETAIRELKEETGYLGNNAEILGNMNVSPNLLSNRLYMVLIKNAVLVGHPQKEPWEWIETFTLPLSQLEQKILSGEVDMGPQLAVVYMAKLKYPQLFL